MSEVRTSVMRTSPFRDVNGDITAAVGPLPVARKGGSSLMSNLAGESSARALVRKYDENGPGIVGFYLDLKADMASLCEYRVQEWDRQKRAWVDSERAVVQALLNELRGPRGETLPDFVRGITRETEAVGEVGMVEVGGGRTDQAALYRLANLDREAWEVVEKAPDGSPLRLGFKGKKGAERPKPGQPASEDYYEAAYGNVTRLWRVHHQWFSEPFSPLHRALKDIRRFDNAGRAIHRAIASQLVMAGLVHFKGTGADMRSLVSGAEKGGRLDDLGVAIKAFMEAGERHLGDIDDEMISGATPYPWVSQEAPTWVDLGRKVDSGLIGVKKDALEDFARDVNIPMSVLTEGQGAAQRMLNEWLQDKAFKQTTVLPDARRTAHGLTVAFLHPRLRALQSSERGKAILDVGGVNRPVTDLRIWPDDTSISYDDPTLENIALGIENGWLKPNVYAEQLRHPEWALKRPDDVSDYDHWLNSVGQESEDEGSQVEPNEDVVASAGSSPWWTPPRG